MKGTIIHVGHDQALPREFVRRIIGIGFACILTTPTSHGEFLHTLVNPLFKELEAAEPVRDKRITYGPKRKGKGGKVRRW